MQKANHIAISKSKRRLFYVILIVIIVMVGLTLAEVASRIKFPASQLEISHFSDLTHDPVLGWKGISGYHGRSFFRVGGVDIDINSDGFRDDDWANKIERAGQTKAKKILFIGDSQLYGWSIEKKDRITEQLAHEYHLEGLPVEIFNAGIPGYGTGQQYRAMEALMPLINPDIVVCNFNHNDFGDSALPYDPIFPHRIYKPLYDLKGNLILYDTVPKRYSLRIKDSPLALFRTKFLIDKIRCWFDDRKYRAMGLAPNRIISNPSIAPLPWGAKVNTLFIGYMFTRDEYEDLYQINKTRNFSLIQKMKTLAENQDAKFIFVLNPPLFHPQNNHEEELQRKLETMGVDIFTQREIQEPYKHWNYVNGDGHVNSIYNYIYAINLFNRLENRNRKPDFSQAAWFDGVPTSLDTKDPKSTRWLFGNWNIEKSKGRWMGERAGCVLRKGGDQIIIDGLMVEGNGTLKIFEMENSLGSVRLNQKGRFSIPVPSEQGDQGLVFIKFEKSPIHSDTDFPLFITKVAN